MKKHFLYIVFCLLFFSYAHAETIILRTGARVKGTIIFQNEEVVVVRDESGARFQYLRADVEQILSDEEAVAAQPEPTVDTEEPEITVSKKASILLELAGGAAVIPGDASGFAASADLLVGSHHIGDRHLFIGGGLGYHGLFLGADKYNFLPIQVALRMPFTEQKHTPVFGVALGYGVALSKEYTGGIYTGVDLGYRCQLNPKTAVAVVAFSQFQQAKINVIITPDKTIPDATFINKAGRNLVVAGVKLALYF